MVGGGRELGEEGSREGREGARAEGVGREGSRVGRGWGEEGPLATVREEF